MCLKIPITCLLKKSIILYSNLLFICFYFNLYSIKYRNNKLGDLIMIESWRWYGPEDPISIEDVMQTDVRDIVTGLYHISNGNIWKINDIRIRQKQVEYSKKLGSTLLKWSVVESIPIHDDIKQGLPTRDHFIQNFCLIFLNYVIFHCKTFKNLHYTRFFFISLFTRARSFPWEWQIRPL